MPSTRFGVAALLLATSIGPGLALAQKNGPGAALLDRIEAKWGGVLVAVRGWSPEGLRQFREGYRDYPTEVLEAALAARSFEKMMDVLDGHAAVRSQQAMDKALRVHNMGETLPEDALDPQVAEAKRVVAKALGDDARDLVFIPITPCTVWDTRFATNPDSMGIVANGTTKRFYSHLNGAGGSYAAYGGNPSCPQTAQDFIGPRPFAVMMTVYVNDASGNGWLTFYRDGDPDPSFATISVYYSPGPTRTQTVISKSSRGYGSGAYDIAATSRFANANASASITGYFVKVSEVGTVSSIATGPGLTGGPITSSGQIDLAATNLLPTAACGATQIPRWSGSAWTCSDDLDTNAGGTVTGVTASAPLQATGGATPNISMTAGTTGQILAATTGNPPAWTSSPTVGGTLTMGGNIVLPLVSGSGSLMKGTYPFLHNHGSSNTFLGFASGNFTMSGSSNTAVGELAMVANVDGYANTAIGIGSLGANTSGYRNSAVGGNALGWNQAGNQNTAVGNQALTQNTSGNSNTAVGHFSMNANASGSFNAAFGEATLQSATGSNNVALGYMAGSQLGAGSFNVYLANTGFNGDQSTMRLGAAVVRSFIAGVRGTTTDLADAIPVLVDSQGQLGTLSSTARVKDDIVDMGAATSGLMKLRPVTFHYRQYGPESPLQYGLIAEEVERVYPGLVARRADGSMETVKYHFLPPMLLNEYQKQQRTIEALQRELAQMKAVLARVEAGIEPKGK